MNTKTPAILVQITTEKILTASEFLHNARKQFSSRARPYLLGIMTVNVDTFDW